MEVTPDIWALYEKTAAESGYKATKDNFGYLQRICVADSDERAYEEGRNFYWQLGRDLRQSATRMDEPSRLRLPSGPPSARPGPPKPAWQASATKRPRRWTRSSPVRPTQ